MRTLDPARNEQILESAARLFHRRRYHEVRMDDVAADAGVAKGTLYRYFRDKEDLYLGLILSSMNRFIADIAPKLAEPLPADERLLQYIEHSLSFCERHPYFIELVQRVEGTTDPARLAPLQDARLSIVRLVAEVVAELDGVRGYRVTDPMLAAIALVGMLRQVMRFLPKPWPSNLADLLAHQFLHGLSPR
jgi:AcrR family transcriptional regulator